MGKKISFPMGDGDIKNGYYNPTTIPAKIQAKKNATATATRMRMAEAGFQAKQVSTRANEPVQSEAFKKGYRNS
jgi:hypothetical protein|tara:strand:+ start:6155 stop:6376 length:222 start_codon:yes stop_codon:yes gene_type:complete